MNSIWVNGAIAFIAALVTTALRGFQSKNVAGSHKRLAFGIGLLMALMEGVVVLVVASGGLHVLPWSAVGAGLGWVIGIVAYETALSDTLAAIKRKKKEKRKRQTEKVVRKVLGYRDEHEPEGWERL